MRHRTGDEYSVLDELTDVQVLMLVFLAGRCDYPPRGFVPATTRALAWRGLVEQDGGHWRATDTGHRAIESLPDLDATGA